MLAGLLLLSPPSGSLLSAQSPVRLREIVTRPIGAALDSNRARVAAAVLPGAAGDPAAGSDVGGALRPGEGAWAVFDFVPGERPLFVEDFAADSLDGPPQRIELVRGAVTVVEWRDTRFLRVATSSDFAITLPEEMPSRFTIEFDLYLPRGRTYPLEVRLALPGEGIGPRSDQNRSRAGVLYCSAVMSGVRGGTTFVVTQLNGAVARTVVPCRFAVDGPEVRAYVADRQVARAPRVDLGEGRRLHFFVPAAGAEVAMIGNLRVMAGVDRGEVDTPGRSAAQRRADRLSATGRVVLPGIRFDPGSDRLRPESTPALQELVDLLTRNPELRLTIEVHTDEGEAAARQLTERQALAIQAFLMTDGGIAAERLSAIGLGASRPVRPNDTPEGRMQNRRVELVRR